MPCRCNDRKDAAERERLARSAMVKRHADAHLTPSTDIAEEQPTQTIDVANMTREQKARAALIRSSADAHRMVNS